MDSIEKKKYIFGSLFLLANKLQVIGDKYLSEGDMTTKQWFLTAMVSQFKDNPPTLSDVAELMGSSRQNVKQLALKLQEKGFIQIQRDKKDARAIRLTVTEKSQLFWENRENKDNQFIIELFKDLSEEEINTICNGLNKVFSKIEKMNNL